MKRTKKMIAMAMTAVLTLSVGINAFAIDSTNPETNGNKTAFDAWVSSVWNNQKYDYTSVSMTPGATASELNFAWYATSAPAAAVRIAKNPEMTDSVMVFDAAGNKDINLVNQDSSATYTKAVRVTVKQLEEETTYYYQYTNDKNDSGSWSAATKVVTGDTSNFKMIYVGDPQIGSSGDVAHDAFNWDRTLDLALQKDNDIDFILSAGDQVEDQRENATDNDDAEVQYAGYLSASVLENVPLATAIGNHESNGEFYNNHFNNPNQTGKGTTTAGGDYYFSYGNTLFISLNSNNTNGAEHDEAMQAAVASNPTAKWRIVMFHHDIYGSGAPHADTDGAAKRTYLAPLMDKYNVDVCLMGHDHAYSRTYQILDGKAVDYEVSANGTIADPQGTLYMTANSASGSKYYELSTVQQYYIAARSQDALPTYSTIEMTDNSFQIKTYRVQDNGTVEDIGDGIKLTKNVDKVSLYNLIQEGQAAADEMTQEKATPSTWNTLQNALTAANTLLETNLDNDIVSKTKNNNQALLKNEELDETYLALLNAMNGLKAKGNAEALNQAIEEAEALVNEAVIGTEAGQYPESAKTELLGVINVAKTIAASVESDQSAMDEMAVVLANAVSTFKGKVIPVTAGTGDSDGSSDGNHDSDSTASNTNHADESKLPQTGDSMSIAVVAILALAGAGMGTAVIIRKAKGNK